MKRRQSNTGGGIASDGFVNDIFGWHLGELLLKHGSLHTIGYDEDPARGHERLEALNRALDHRAFANDFEKLLRRFLPAAGPETGSDSASHDDPEYVRHDFYRLLKLVEKRCRI
jgi:hypothetical protein